VFATGLFGPPGPGPAPPVLGPIDPVPLINSCCAGEKLIVPSAFIDSPVGNGRDPFVLKESDSRALGLPLGPGVGSDTQLKRWV
jgi:hypothetical protein